MQPIHLQWMNEIFLKSQKGGYFYGMKALPPLLLHALWQMQVMDAPSPSILYSSFKNIGEPLSFVLNPQTQITNTADTES